MPFLQKMCVLLEPSHLMVTLKSQSGTTAGFEFGQHRGSGKFQGYKDSLNSLIPAPTMVGGQRALTHFI